MRCSTTSSLSLSPITVPRRSTPKYEWSQAMRAGGFQSRCAMASGGACRMPHARYLRSAEAGIAFEATATPGAASDSETQPSSACVSAAKARESPSTIVTQRSRRSRRSAESGIGAGGDVEAGGSLAEGTEGEEDSETGDAGVSADDICGRARPAGARWRSSCRRA